MNKLTAFIILISTLMLTSCINLLPKVDDKVQRVNLTELKLVLKSRPSQYIIKIIKPTCNEYLNTIRISFQEQRDNLLYADYLANIEWQDPLPLLVQDHLNRLIRNSGQFKAVALVHDKFHADYMVQTHIHQFSVMKQHHRLQAKIELTVTLIRARDQAIVAQKTFMHHEVITSESLVNFVQGIDRAFMNIQQSIMDWIKDSSL